MSDEAEMLINCLIDVRHYFVIKNQEKQECILFLTLHVVSFQNVCDHFPLRNV